MSAFLSIMRTGQRPLDTTYAPASGDYVPGLGDANTFVPRSPEQVLAPAPAGPAETFTAPQPSYEMSANPFDQIPEEPMQMPAQEPMAAPPQQLPPAQALPPQQLPPANPFDQFAADPAPVDAQASGHDIRASNGAISAEMLDPAQLAAMEALRTELTELVNSGATVEQIRAWEASNGFEANSLGDIDAVVEYRDRYGTTVPVGINAASAVIRKPQGEDRGRANSAILGAIDGVTLGAGDEIDAAIGATVGGLNGDDSTWQERYDARVTDNRQLLDDASHYHGGYYMGGQVAGGLAGAAAMPMGGVVRGASLGRMAVQGAREGAVLGGAYGFNSAEGGLDERLSEGVKGAALGAGMGIVTAPLVRGADRIMEQRAFGGSHGRQVLDAADRLNARAPGAQPIRPLPGHVSDQGPLALGQALLEPNLVGGSMSRLKAATTRFDEAVEGAVQRTAEGAAAGPVHSLQEAANYVRDPRRQGSMGAFENEARQRAQTGYNAAAQAAGDTRLQTPRTINRIDDILDRWREVPGGVPGTAQLEDLRETLAAGNFSVDGLRRLRTSFGDAIDSTNRTLKEEATALWPVLSQDITQGLRKQGRGDAASLYRQADRQYARDLEARGIIEKIVGKDADLSAHRVAERLAIMGQKDADQLAHVLGRMDVQHAGMIRGGIIHNMGLRQASRATDELEFSLESFATNWSKMGGPARDALFDARTIQDLSDLATLARSDRAVAQLGNPSRSGIIHENYRQIGQIISVGSVGAGAAVSPLAFAPLVAMWGGGVLLARPGIARALVRYANSGKVEVLYRRLSEAARRSPGAQQEILGFRDAVTNPNAMNVPVEAPAEAPDETVSAEPNPFDQFDMPLAPDEASEEALPEEDEAEDNPFDQFD